MNLLNQTCKIERATITKNQYKQTVKTWATIEPEAKCNIQQDRSVVSNYDQSNTGLKISGRFIGFFDRSQNILKGDKITWSGLTLFVDGLPAPIFASLSSSHHLEVALSVEET